MEFIAKKDNKEKIVTAEDSYLVEKIKLKSSTQILLAWKKRKDELRREGWNIHVVDVNLVSEPEIKMEKIDKSKRVAFTMFGKTFYDEEVR